MNLKIEFAESGAGSGSRAVADAIREFIEPALAQGGIKVDTANVAQECRNAGKPELATATTRDAEKALRSILTKFARNAEKRATMRKVSGTVWYLAAL